MGRRQRKLAAPSGLILLACLFLPAVKGCSEPIYPIEVPIFWTPYVLGGLVAALALARRLGPVRVLTTIVLVLVVLTGGGFGLVVGWTSRGDDIAVLVCIGLWVASVVYAVLVQRGGDPEERAARAVLGAGILCTPWFALWAFDPDGLIGVRVSLAASIGLIIAGAEWRREVARARAISHPVPPARARPG